MDNLSSAFIFSSKMLKTFHVGIFFFNFLCFQLSISSVNATKPGQIWSHLLIKSLMKNLIFCAMFCHCMTILVIFVHFQNFNYYSSIIIVRFVVQLQSIWNFQVSLFPHFKTFSNIQFTVIFRRKVWKQKFAVEHHSCIFTTESTNQRTVY